MTSATTSSRRTTTSKASSAARRTRRSSSLPAARPTASGRPTTTTSATREVDVISKLPGGEPIPLAANRTAEEKAIDFRGVSTDGTHILMETPATPATGELAYLFLRVNDAITYDISEGHPVTPDRDDPERGKGLLHDSGAQLVPDDTDSSVDLYSGARTARRRRTHAALAGQRQGQHRRLRRLLGPSGCGVEFLRPELPHPDRGQPHVSRAGHGRPVRRRQRRHLLLLARAPRPGTARACRTSGISTSSATAQSNSSRRWTRAPQVTRMQISPDGRHAAILTSLDG